MMRGRPNSISLSIFHLEHGIDDELTNTIYYIHKQAIFSARKAKGQRKPGLDKERWDFRQD